MWYNGHTQWEVFGMKKRMTTKQIVMVGLLAALVEIASGLRVTLPVSIGGNSYFHLGNIFCALSGVLLGPWYGGLAAGLGSMIYDMLDPRFLAECWLTFLMKGAYGLVVGLAFSRGEGRWCYGRILAATTAGAVSYGLLYLGKSYLKALWIQGLSAQVAWIAVAEKLPATVFNAGVAMAFTPVLALSLHAALARSRLTLE